MLRGLNMVWGHYMMGMENPARILSLQVAGMGKTEILLSRLSSVTIRFSPTILLDLFFFALQILIMLHHIFIMNQDFLILLVA